MSIGTNITEHVSSLARDHNLDPFVANNKAFVDGGDLQKIMENFDLSALMEYPSPDEANETTVGSVKIATDKEATELTSGYSIFSPKSLVTMKAANSPSVDSLSGWVKVVSSTSRNITNDPVKRIMTLEKIEDFVGIRTALEDDSGRDDGIGGTGTLNGVLKFASRNETLSYAPDRYISPQKTLELIQKEVIGQWVPSTEKIKGIARTISISDGELSLSTGIVITVNGIDNMVATPTKRAPLYIADMNTKIDSSGTDIGITPATIKYIAPTPTNYGFVKYSSDINNSSTTDVVTAKQGYDLQNNLIGYVGGSISGVLRTDNIYTKYSTEYKQKLKEGNYIYRNSTSKVKLFVDGRLDEKLAFLAAHPYGSVWMTTRDVDPATEYGGRWYREQGTTLLGSGKLTTHGVSRTFRRNHRGGLSDYAIREKHLPSHQHLGFGEHKSYALGFGYDATKGKRNLGSGDRDNDNYLYYDSPVGGGEPHENMMPYEVVYFWRRIA